MSTRQRIMLCKTLVYCACRSTAMNCVEGANNTVYRRTGWTTFHDIQRFEKAREKECVQRSAHVTCMIYVDDQDHWRCLLEPGGYYPRQNIGGECSRQQICACIRSWFVVSGLSGGGCSIFSLFLDHSHSASPHRHPQVHGN